MYKYFMKKATEIHCRFLYLHYVQNNNNNNIVRHRRPWTSFFYVELKFINFSLHQPHIVVSYTINKTYKSRSKIKFMFVT